MPAEEASEGGVSEEGGGTAPLPGPRPGDTSLPADEALVGGVSREGGRAPLPHPPGADTSPPADEALEDGVSREGGRAPLPHPPGADTSSPADEASEVRRQNEELLQGKWYYTRTPRSTRDRDKPLAYAVIAVDKGLVEELMEYWQKEGYPQRDNAKGDAANALRIAAVARRKGQGLLLTVEEVAEEKYKSHKEKKVNLYWNTYGRHPYHLRGHPYA